MQIILLFPNQEMAPFEVDHLHTIWSLRRLIAEDNRLMEERIHLFRGGVLLQDEELIQENDVIQVIFESIAHKKRRLRGNEC